jgi:hypothetical protein
MKKKNTKHTKKRKIIKEGKNETCALCGARTNYTEDDPIGHRYGYVKGTGQLCFRCSYFGGHGKEI